MRVRPLVPAVLAVALVSAGLAAQTRITPPKNRFTPEQDVQLGREAAEQVRQQYPIISNDAISDYLARLGERLVAQAPAELDLPVFEYSFTPVNLQEINAFALPGGPMFVNRGMIEAASSEGEVVGVMAHELSHVLLRHGTANATKAQGFQLGALAGAIAGAVIGGGWGEAIAQGTEFGLGTWLMKYSREYEKQADLLGAQIMARAGYDPRDLGRMFETIQSRGRGGAPPEWLSSHPDPGNRSRYIAEEASRLQIARAQPTGRFEDVRRALASLPPARSMADLARNDSGGRGGEAPATTGVIGNPVPPPSSRYRTARGGRLFQVQVPDNWQAVSSTNSVKYVPENGLGVSSGTSVLTHGVELGVARASSRDLREATRTLVQAFVQSNAGLEQAGAQQTTTISGRTALATPLVGRSVLGGTERIGLYTTLLADGSLFYYLTVVPERDAAAYQGAFERVGRSIRLSDR